MILTDVERLILINQYKILKALKVPEERGSYDEIIEGLEGGFETAYQHLFQGIQEHATLSAEKCEEAETIMEMFSKLNECFVELDEGCKAGIDKSLLEFWGFDDHGDADEAAYCRYFEYFVGTRGRFSELTRQDYASHGMHLEAYRRMLSVYLPIRKALREQQRQLNRDEILAILNARDYPSNDAYHTQKSC